MITTALAVRPSLRDDFANHFLQIICKPSAVSKAVAGGRVPPPRPEAGLGLSRSQNRSGTWPWPPRQPRRHLEGSIRNRSTKRINHDTYFCSVHSQVEIPVPWQLEGHFGSGGAFFIPKGVLLRRWAETKLRWSRGNRAPGVRSPPRQMLARQGSIHQCTSSSLLCERLRTTP